MSPLVRSAARHSVSLLSGGAAALLFTGNPFPALACGGLAVTLGLALAATGALARTLVVVTVQGSSMEPAYYDGDRVLVRRGAPPEPGQVVVMERPAAGIGWTAPPVPTGADPATVSARQWLIKRVAAVPGDPVPYEMTVAGERFPHVPTGRVVLFGDNRAASHDSRQMGYFPVERLLGAVLRPLPR
ncbi:S26 family signal peptidase [Streptomyces odonnellii]|uniref:S26 family signal peptidase n=1 Tax=Streptomyces odonnellii TaxID=1417980 RepID=UPI000AF674CE|nr:S26 family signal peptidase [Streptomyces odonnellii]